MGEVNPFKEVVYTPAKLYSQELYRIRNRMEEIEKEWRRIYRQRETQGITRKDEERMEWLQEQRKGIYGKLYRTVRMGKRVFPSLSREDLRDLTVDVFTGAVGKKVIITEDPKYEVKYQDYVDWAVNRKYNPREKRYDVRDKK